MNEQIKGVIYLSKAKEPFKIPELAQLVDHAACTNEIHQVTGFIVYDNTYFLQYVEGESSVVDQLMSNIQNDQRHQMIRSCPINISMRKFQKWSTEWSKSQICMEMVLLDYLKAIQLTPVLKETQRDNIQRMLEEIADYHLFNEIHS